MSRMPCDIQRWSRDATPTWEWEEEAYRVDCLKNGTVCVANRDRATKQLQDIHEHNYKRVIKFPGGWVIPIVDTVRGSSQSYFAVHYIRICRETWSHVQERSPFQRTLRECCTVHLEFGKGELLTNVLDGVVIRKLVAALCDQFKRPPSILSSPPSTVNEFVKDLTDQVGPLFIVLDDIGATFEGDEVKCEVKIDKFMEFCGEIVGRWLTIPKVFFLLLGHATFLSYVGSNVMADLPQCCFTLCRLSLTLLRPDAIRTIISTTRMGERDDRTIKDAYDLGDAHVEAVAQHLFNETYPQSLIRALVQCRSCEEPLTCRQVAQVPSWRGSFT
ncbi:hypothetical protein FI667_g9561, partial [Globisporangium splendens]